MSGKRGKHKRLHLGIILEAEEADNERSSLIFKVSCVTGGGPCFGDRLLIRICILVSSYLR